MSFRSLFQVYDEPKRLVDGKLLRPTYDKIFSTSGQTLSGKGDGSMVLKSWLMSRRFSSMLWITLQDTSLTEEHECTHNFGVGR